jgi:hypothetical protein
MSLQFRIQTRFMTFLKLPARRVTQLVAKTSSNYSFDQNSASVKEESFSTITTASQQMIERNRSRGASRLSNDCRSTEGDIRMSGKRQMKKQSKPKKSLQLVARVFSALKE